MAGCTSEREPGHHPATHRGHPLHRQKGEVSPDTQTASARVHAASCVDFEPSTMQRLIENILQQLYIAVSLKMQCRAHSTMKHRNTLHM
jgi:hypothetical protein